MAGGGSREVRSPTLRLDPEVRRRAEQIALVTKQRFVQDAKDLRRPILPDPRRPNRLPRDPHDGRGLSALAADISDHDPEGSARAVERIVEVPPHLDRPG